MRKIYSLVLMTAMLLIGTNVLADNEIWRGLDIEQQEGHTYEAKLTVGDSHGYATTLATAFAKVEVDEVATIELLKEVTVSSTIKIYSDPTSDSKKQITLNMNENNIKFSATPFMLYKGKFEITGHGSISSLHTYKDKASSPFGGYGVVVYGSNDRSKEHWSDLTIGQDVTISAPYAPIQVNVFFSDPPEEYPHRTYWTKDKQVTEQAMLNQWGIPSGTTFGSIDKPAPQTGKYGQQGCAYGVNIVVNGTLQGYRYGLQTIGYLNQTPESQKTTAQIIAYPTITVSSTANVYSAGDLVDGSADSIAMGTDKPCAIYSSGYAKWTISGNVSGANGIYIKSGDVTINGEAKISSNASVTGENKSTTSGVTGKGDAVITNSNWTTATISVTVNDNPTISTHADGGTAIHEVNTTTNNENQVSNITINGGTFEGGVNGAAATISDSFDGTIEVTGGTYTGNIETLLDALPDDGASLIQDVVSQEGGTATVVIGPKQQDDAPVVINNNYQDTINFDWSQVNANSVVNLKASYNTNNLTYYINDTKIPSSKTTSVRYLSLKGSVKDANTYTNKLIIQDNHTLIVDQIVMDAYASIVVEPGSKLFVTGTNGIFANNVNNLILEASEDGTALFVMSPDVRTNKQPKATVQIYSTAYQKNASEWIWQRISFPLSSFDSFDRIYTGDYTTDDHLKTWAKYWNSETNTWENVPGGFAGMTPFKSYALVNNTIAGGAIYAVKGNMQGVVDGSMVFDQPGWNFFGNSYTAPIHLRTLLNAIWTSAPEADGTIWYFNNATQGYTFENKALFEEGINNHVQVAPLETFVIRLNSGTSAVASADYETSVWDYNTMSEDDFEAAHPANAPQRVACQKNIVRITVSDVNGMSDNMILLEGENYSADYENGADAYKVMNVGLNIFAVEDEEYAMVATDDILGTLISLTTGEEINYTLSFSNVRGEVYALRDNLTNTVVLMNEGATYNFTAQSNATLDGRFQIVSRQEMPTAVETVEEIVNAPKAIYTIMGQYVGETTDWNNLPAGVYVVDGIKVIK